MFPISGCRGTEQKSHVTDDKAEWQCPGCMRPPGSRARVPVCHTILTAAHSPAQHPSEARPLPPASTLTAIPLRTGLRLPHVPSLSPDSQPRFSPLLHALTVSSLSYPRKPRSHWEHLHPGGPPPTRWMDQHRPGLWLAGAGNSWAEHLASLLGHVFPVHTFPFPCFFHLAPWGTAERSKYLPGQLLVSGWAKSLCKE